MNDSVNGGMPVIDRSTVTQGFIISVSIKTQRQITNNVEYCNTGSIGKMHNRFGILGVWSDIMFEDYERYNEMKANEIKQYVLISAGQVKQKS